MKRVYLSVMQLSNQAVSFCLALLQGRVVVVVCFFKHILHKEGSQPEWCISTIYHA